MIKESIGLGAGVKYLLEGMHPMTLPKKTGLGDLTLQILNWSFIGFAEVFGSQLRCHFAVLDNYISKCREAYTQALLVWQIS